MFYYLTSHTLANDFSKSDYLSTTLELLKHVYWFILYSQQSKGITKILSPLFCLYKNESSKNEKTRPG